jgi:hypothetical protein
MEQRIAALAACLVLAAAPALAQDKKDDKGAAPDLTKPAGTEAASVSTVGDWFKFNVEVKGFKPTDGGEAVTAPQGSCFRVSNEFADSTGSAMLRGRFETGTFAHGIWPPYSCADVKPGTDSRGINPAVSYDVARRNVLEDYDRDRFGWTYGVLVAPVKYYVKPHEFSAGASVGPYLGYRLHDRQGASNVFALSVGAATATITTNNPDGSSSSTNTTGLTVAAAYIVDIKSAFNVGLLAGTDIFSKSQNVPTSNKLWLGLSFGYKLE